MHQWPSEVFQVGVLALSFFLETKHNFPQCCTCRSENLTHNSSYRWSLEYFQAYDQKWHQTLESALLTSLYANFAGGNVYIFRVDVYGYMEIKPVQSLMRCKVTWAICVILYSLQEISNEILPPSKLQNSLWVTKRVMSNTFFEEFSVFFLLKSLWSSQQDEVYFMCGGAAGGLWRHQQCWPSWIIPRIRNQVKIEINGNFWCLTRKIGHE